MALTQSAHILLIARRDPQDPIRRILRDAGYPVVFADSPSAGVRAAQRARPAVIVADRRALTVAGREDLASFAIERQIPLILEWSDPEGLVAEVQHLLGRPESLGREARQLVVGSLQVDLASRVAQVNSVPLDLTAKEFDLLCHFARHPGWVWSRQELLEQVWGYEYGDTRVVTVHIANLRKKLSASAPGSDLIETVRNIGYKLAVPAPVDEVVSAASRPAESDTEAALARTPPPEASYLETPSAGTPTPVTLLEGDRRLVTVLVADIGGLTALAETRDPESMRDLINALFDCVVPCIERYRGVVDTFIGDRVMALFGAPIAQDNDAEMALRAALDVSAAIAGFGEQHGIEALVAHVGVDTGMVVAGPVGGRSVKEYSIVGDAVNVASRLAELSSPAEILIGPETFTLAGDAIEAEPAGTVTARGKAGDVPYYRLKAVREGRRTTETALGINSVLVGREEQLSLFRGALDRLREGIGGVISVVGEAGLGKSRLTAEVRRQAASRNLKWLEGRTLSYGQSMSYLPFKEILQADCGIEADDPVPTRERKLQARLGRLFADRSGEFLPILEILLGITSGRSERQPEWPDEESVRSILFDRLTRYVSRLGTEEPVILVFEDVHWLDRSSASLIENLLPLTARAPVIICLVGRGGAGSWILELLEFVRSSDDLRSVEALLPPLSSKQTQELICNLLRRTDVEPRLMRAIERKSEGNPFFVEEIIRHLIDSGQLRSDRLGGWRAASTRIDVPIPNTLRGVIRARIDRLPEGAKQELLHASVIGRSFLYGLLRSLTPADEAEFSSRLTYLQDHQLIFVRQREPELEYAFKHALVQEAAYEGILLKQRRELHLQLARAIEDQFSERTRDLYGILAYHYTKAEDWNKAQDYLLKAGDQSVSMAAGAEAVAQYEEAMAALLRAFDETWEAPESHDRVSWFVQRTEPFWLARCLGDLTDPAQVFYEKVSTACGPADPRTLAATTVLAGCYYQGGLYDQGAGIIEEALRSLERSGAEDDPSLSRLLLLLGLCRLNADRFSEGEALLTRALSLESAKTPVDEGLLQDLYIYLSSAHYLTGRHDDLRRVAEEALESFELGGTQRYWMLLINLCSSNLVVGKWDEAASLAQRCVDGVANPFLRAVASRHLGEVRHAQGAYLEAEEHLRYSVVTLEELGDASATAEALKDLAEIQLQAGKPEKAEETSQQAIRLMETALSASHSDIAGACWTLAGVEMRRGHLTDAERLLERSAKVVGEKYSLRHPFRAELYFRRAQLRAMQGRTLEAEEDLRQAVQLLAELGGENHPRIRQMKAQWEVGGTEW